MVSNVLWALCVGDDGVDPELGERECIKSLVWCCPLLQLLPSSLSTFLKQVSSVWDTDTRQRDGDGSSSLMDHNRVCPCMCAVCAGPRGHRVGDVKAGRTPCLLSLTFVALPIFGSPIPRDLPSPHSWDIPRNHGPPNSPCSPLTLWKDFSFDYRVLRVKC